MPWTCGGGHLEAAHAERRRLQEENTRLRPAAAASTTPSSTRPPRSQHCLIIKLKIIPATQIVDLYHAREHLHDLGKLLVFLLGDSSGNWLAERSGELDDGDIPALLSAARAFPLTGTKAEELDTALGYFQANARRMRNKHFRFCGLSVGSGGVEAGYKAGNASNSPACTGPSPAPPASSPRAASKPAAAGKKSGNGRATTTSSLNRSAAARTTRLPWPGQVTEQSPTSLSHTRGPADRRCSRDCHLPVLSSTCAR